MKQGLWNSLFGYQQLVEVERGNCRERTPNKDRIVMRLRSSFERGRITLDELVRLEKALKGYAFDETIGVMPKPVFANADENALWRARILQRQPRRPAWFIAWLACWFAITVIFLNITRFVSLPIDTFMKMGDLNVYLAVVISFGLVYVCWSRWYKGEWLLDAALSRLRYSPLLLLYSLNSLPEAASFWTDVRRVIVVVGLAIFGVLMLQSILWVFGRDPYKRLRYPGSFF
jgi:hypothetical protein